MFPENRYVRERNERKTPVSREGAAEAATEPSAPPQEAAPLLPPPALPQLEKRQAERFRPLPGGGSRRLEYQGLLNARELDRVERNYPVYKEAEQRTGVNWKILAAIHYRESSLGQDPRARGNEFQFDGSYRKLATGDLLRDAITAGRILQEKNRQAGNPPLSEGGFAGPKVQEALFRYNGTLYRRAEASPYVMNQFDEAHSGMALYRGKNAQPSWGRDARLGAYTVIRELTRAFAA